MVDECYDSKLREAERDNEEYHCGIFALRSYQRSGPGTQTEVGGYFEIRLNLISTQSRDRSPETVVCLQQYGDRLCDTKYLAIFISKCC